MDINYVDADHIEIKREDQGVCYHYGMFDKTKNEMHGIVRCVDKFGTIFEGMYQNGEKNGFGRAFWSNGDCYIGMWKDDNFHGHGRYMQANGQVKEGQFENDNFLG